MSFPRQCGMSMPRFKTHPFSPEYALSLQPRLAKRRFLRWPMRSRSSRTFIFFSQYMRRRFGFAFMHTVLVTLKMTTFKSMSGSIPNIPQFLYRPSLLTWTKPSGTPKTELIRLTSSGPIASSSTHMIPTVDHGRMPRRLHRMRNEHPKAGLFAMGRDSPSLAPTALGSPTAVGLVSVPDAFSRSASCLLHVQ